MKENLKDKIKLETILNNKLKLTKREKEIFDATYEYAFKMWVTRAWMSLLKEWQAEIIFEY